MKKAKLAISILCACMFLFQGITAAPNVNAATLGVHSKIESVIEQYISSKYHLISQLSVSAKGIEMDTECVSEKAISFRQIERAILSSYVSLMLSCKNSPRFSIKDLDCSYRYATLCGTSADVYVSVRCKFNYDITPDVNSETGEILRIYLHNSGTGWEITGRDYISDFDRAFWGCKEPTVDNALRREQEIYAIANSLAERKSITTEFYDEWECGDADGNDLETRSVATYNASGAVGWALANVAPISSTWNDAGGYSYSYPSPYSQFYHDCTNYVSVCMNLGGDIPFDTTAYPYNNGGDVWFYNSPNTAGATYSFSWATVGSLGLYLEGGATASDGIYSIKAYQNSSYPSTLTNSTIRAGDIVQFYDGSIGSWNHSAIITYYKPVLDIAYICQHDANQYMSQCSLEGYYTAVYASSGSLIRFFDVRGYYN